MFDRYNPPASICIMRLSAIGDVCHTIPVVRTLQHYWPETKITWIIGKAEATLVGDIPDINFIIFNKADGLSAYKKLRTALKGQQFDLLLHLQESLRSSIATLFIKAKVKLGFNKQDAQDHQWLFCNQQIDFIPRQHYMDRLLQFTEKLELTPPEIRWDIPISTEDEKQALKLLPDGNPFIVISPCSSVVKRNWRNWTVEGYAAIADLAKTEYGLNVVFTGGPAQHEKLFGEKIQAKMNTTATNLIGKLTLKQLLATIKKSSAVISPDSGPAHMATTVGVPAISLFTTSNPNFTGPYYSKDWIVNKYPEALEKYNHTNVQDAPWGQRVRNPEAVELITVDDIAQKLATLPAATLSRKESL